MPTLGPDSLDSGTARVRRGGAFAGPSYFLAVGDGGLEGQVTAVDAIWVFLRRLSPSRTFVLLPENREVGLPTCRTSPAASPIG